MKEIQQPFTRCLLNLFTCPLCLFSLRDDKPTPQENNSEVLKALQDDESSITGVAGMAELQEDRYESITNRNPNSCICLIIYYPNFLLLRLIKL